VEVADAAKEKDGILSLQLLESKVDHSVLCHFVSCSRISNVSIVYFILYFLCYWCVYINCQYMYIPILADNEFASVMLLMSC